MSYVHKRSHPGMVVTKCVGRTGRRDTKGEPAIAPVIVPYSVLLVFELPNSSCVPSYKFCVYPEFAMRSPCSGGVSPSTLMDVRNPVPLCGGRGWALINSLPITGESNRRGGSTDLGH